MGKKKTIQRCVRCKSTRFKAATRAQPYQVGDTLFRVRVPSRRCASCGETYTSFAALESGRRAVAREIATRGPISGASFRFMREAVGMLAVGVAELLAVSVGTVSRWENGRVPVDRAAWLTMGGMVLDQTEGRTTTRDRLKAIERNRTGKTIRIEL